MKILLHLLICILICACTHQEIVTPDPVNPVFTNAEKQFLRGAYQKSLELYKQYLTDYPDGDMAADALMREGQIYMLKDNYPLARSTYQHLLDQYPHGNWVSEARNLILHSFYEEGHYDQVIKKGQDLLRNHPSMLNVYELMGDATMALKNPVKAIEYYQKNNNIAKIKTALNRISIQELETVLEKSGTSPLRHTLLYQLGWRCFQEEQYEKTKVVFQDLLREYPAHPDRSQAEAMLSKIEKMPVYNRFTIGALLPLSGPYQAFGAKALKGIQLALGQSGSLPGQPSINIIIKDTASDPNQTIQLVRQLAAEKVSAIIGPIATAIPAAQEAQQNKIPIITMTLRQGVTAVGDYVFRNFLTRKMQVESIVFHAMQNMKIQNFAVLYPDGKYGETFMNLFWDEVTHYGGKISGVEPYDPGLTDFSDPIKRLVGTFYQPKSLEKQKLKSIVDFEAIFIPDSPTKAGLIIPQLVYYNVTDVYLMGTKLWHSPRLLKMAGQFVQGALIPEGFFEQSSLPRVKKFVKTFKNTFDEKPEFLAALAFDTTKILFQLLRRNDIRFRSTLKYELGKLRNYPGVTGNTSFDHSGEAHKSLHLLTIKGNKFIEIER